MSNINIAYFSQPAVAPHQNMMLAYLKENHSHEYTIREVKIPRGKGVFDQAWTVMKVMHFCLFHREDVLYFSGFVSARYAYLAYALGHRRWVYHSQDWIFDRKDFRAQLERVVVRNAPAVIWNEHIRARAARKVSGRRSAIHVVPTYLPIAYTLPDPCPNLREKIKNNGIQCSDQTAIVFAGGYSEARMSKYLVAAFEKVDENCVLVFTGSERVPRPWPRNVMDLGELSYKEMLSVVSASDIGILLYDYKKSFGNRIQQPGRLTEYLRAGLSVISTPFPVAKRIERELDSYICVNGYDVEELRVALKSLCSTVCVRRNNRSRIITYAVDNLGYERAAKKVISEIIENHLNDN
ncbi:hypothetical protein [Mesorhizobium sp. M0898]|uniref:hypothetical protein n=1 Tax=Mesorhizobium sp. M0898 TaxID=2957020 RepID=UPI00333C4574